MECSDIANQSLHDQWRQLIRDPLSKLDEKACPSPYIFVVDALDECDQENDIRIILNVLAEVRSLTTVRPRFLITSRPEVPIRYGFYQIPETEHHDFVLHNMSREILDNDISIFLEHNLGIIRQECYLASDWPGEHDTNRLVQNANGLFIWAATACRFIREGRSLAEDRLSMVLKDDSSAHYSDTDDSSTDGTAVDDSAVGPEKQLNEIYRTVLKNPVRNFTKKEKKKWYKLLRETVGAIILLFSPLSAFSLASLLDVGGKDIMRTLNDLHSILDIQENSVTPIRLHHPSFRDFLLDKKRCGDPNFLVDEKQAHQKLANDCMRLMSTSLKQDICGLDTPGILLADVDSSQVEQYLPPELQYACLYWVQHLQKSNAHIYDHGQVHQFLRAHLLFWLEALGWVRKISEGILAIISFESIALVSFI